MTESPTTARADALLDRLEAVQARGGERFDGPGCRCVRALADRAITLGSERLVARAEARLDALEASLARARESTEAALDELTAAGTPGTRALRAALSRGDVSRARRGVRRLRTLPPLAAAPESALDAASERYRRAAAKFSCSVTIARARANLPAAAGPYNSTLVATHTLDRLATTSPTYLHALVERLEDLAALKRLAPPPEPAPKPARKRSKGARSKAKDRKPKASKRRKA